jgi:hypothetical protein
VTGGATQGIIAVVPAGALLECYPAGALVTPLLQIKDALGVMAHPSTGAERHCFE